MAYASTTTVAVAKTRAEIEQIVTRYGASDFASGWRDNGAKAQIQFKSRGRTVRFVLTLPKKDERRFTHHSQGRRTPDSQEKEWEQACRALWRSLLLSIKAKLESVASGIAVFDEEFLSYVVQPNGRTIGESVLPMLEAIMEGSQPALPGPGESTVQQ